jgi:hypothetical protein
MQYSLYFDIIVLSFYVAYNMEYFALTQSTILIYIIDHPGFMFSNFKIWFSIIFKGSLKLGFYLGFS